jgi:hypothetical protein
MEARIAQPLWSVTSNAQKKLAQLTVSGALGQVGRLAMRHVVKVHRHAAAAFMSTLISEASSVKVLLMRSKVASSQIVPSMLNGLTGKTGAFAMKPVVWVGTHESEAWQLRRSSVVFRPKDHHMRCRNAS